jgi:hypothetical protein
MFSGRLDGSLNILLLIASSMMQAGEDVGIWDEEDGFLYDVLRGMHLLQAPRLSRSCNSASWPQPQSRVGAE